MSQSITPPKPARLAFVITELEVGGAERTLTNLVLGLDRTKFDPVVYSLWGRPAAHQSELVDRLEAGGVPLRFVNLRRATQLQTGVKRLQRMLSDQQPQLLQAFLFHANVVGAYAGWRLKVPHILLGLRVADRSAWRMMMERMAARVADRVVCVSESVRTFAESEAHLPKEKLLVIPNGIDVERFQSGAKTAQSPVSVLPSDRRFIAVIGRLHKQKGVDWFLELAPPLLRDFPDVDVVIVGDGPERATLVDLASSLGIGGRVRFVGWHADVIPFLLQASVLVLPSRWEGMPNVVLEAMAATKPVVATAVEGVGELLGELGNLQMVPVGSPELFASRIGEILRDSVRAQELGQMNRTRAATEFSLEVMISRYDSLYSALLGGC